MSATKTARRLGSSHYWATRAGTLNAYARRRGARGTVTADQLRFLVVYSDLLCHWCGVEMRLGSGGRRPLLTFDHVHGIGAGGPNTIENLVCACKTCNQGRRDCGEENG